MPEDGTERDLHDAEALLVEVDLVYADGLLRGLLVPENALTQEQLARVLLGLARVEGLRGRDARSERYLREALRHNPYNENVAHLLGEVAEQRGAAKEVTSWSQQAEFHDRDPLPESRDSLEGRR